MSTIRAQRYKKIIENRPFFTKKLSIIFFKEKGQRASPSSKFNAALPRFKVQRAFGPVQGSTGLWPSSRFKATSYFLHHPSSFRHQTSYFLPLTSSFLLLPSYFFHLTSFRTSPVPFNLEGAPPLSCILPPQGEENRSACRSYIKVSADHQRSGLGFAPYGKVKGRRTKGASTFLHQTSSFRHHPSYFFSNITCHRMTTVF